MGINSERLFHLIDRIANDHIEQGVALGIKKRQYLAAEKLIRKGFSIDTVEEITGIYLGIKLPDELKAGSLSAKYVNQGMADGFAQETKRIEQILVSKGYSEKLIKSIVNN